LKQFIELNYFGEEFTQTHKQFNVVWDGIDEGFVGLRIPNCVSIILELQMIDSFDAEPIQWLDISDISIEFDR